ncbi:hypothetical protein L218DRAFT_438960 [Marasmius fiardii PR-910]|nr:hypothetical protein L218DRAFT_438960 [Marasmius fiardii PR-910]
MSRAGSLAATTAGPRTDEITSHALWRIVLAALPSAEYKGATFPPVFILSFVMAITTESSYARFLNHPYIYDAPSYDDYIAEPHRALQRFREDVELKFNEICNEAEVNRSTTEPNEDRVEESSSQGLDEIFDVAGYCTARATEQQVTRHHDSCSITTNPSRTADEDDNKNFHFISNLIDAGIVVSQNGADAPNAHLPIPTPLLSLEQIADMLQKAQEAIFTPEKMTDELLAQVAPFVSLLLEEAGGVPVMNTLRPPVTFNTSAAAGQRQPKTSTEH